MKIHLLGGFLGAGKTTAIIGAAKQLMAQGKTVGIITNDQGKYLVDTAFFRLADLPTVEVTGGCFCCNYGDLDEQIDVLIDSLHPDVIFAESVGSCADLIATVIRPLQTFRVGSEEPTTYSVITDARLLRLLLEGDELPFSENVSYIFEKQIEESGLLIINKIDLLSASERDVLVEKAKTQFAGKEILAQNSLTEEGTSAWLERIESMETTVPKSTLNLDYEKYGAGEADLAWLDERLHFSEAGSRGREFIIEFVGTIDREIRRRGYPIGHLKAEISAGGVHCKVSFVALETAGWEVLVPEMPQDAVITVLLNGRVQCTAQVLQKLVEEVVLSLTAKFNVFLMEDALDSFNPGFPNPTHRFVGK